MEYVIDDDFEFVVPEPDTDVAAGKYIVGDRMSHHVWISDVNLMS
jgi:hypothetical protein